MRGEATPKELRSARDGYAILDIAGLPFFEDYIWMGCAALAHINRPSSYSPDANSNAMRFGRFQIYLGD
jgi:hypothetical protein